MLGWRRNPQQSTFNAQPPQQQQFSQSDHLAPAPSNGSGSGAGDDGGGPGGGGMERDVPTTLFSVTRSVCLPRVTLTTRTADSVVVLGGGGCGVGSTDSSGCGTKRRVICGDGSGMQGLRPGINPLYIEDEEGMQADDEGSGNTKPHNVRQSTPRSGEKSSSSGYGSSQGPYHFEHIKSKQDAISILAQNPNYVKSIRIGTASKQDPMIRRTKQPPNGTYGSGSSATTLSTIPEGQVDFTIPRPIWPPYHRSSDYDSLVDEAILLYTSLNYKPELAQAVSSSELSVKEVLTDLLHNVNATITGTNAITAEDMLKTINRKLESSLEALKNVTEEEMRLLCVNLSNSNKVGSVLRAFSTNNSSASTSTNNSSHCSPQWTSSSCVPTTTSSCIAEELYHIPSGSSSGGFSDRPAIQVVPPVFVHDNIGSVSKGVRNALIYGTGTVCRSKQLITVVGLSENKCLHGDGIISAGRGMEQAPKKSLLTAAEGSKPSVWEQYYGVKPEGGVTTYVPPKPSDVPLYPGGRPEADFTLDVPRSEMLSKRMKADKKWRCRCRVLTSFLGLVFFLLSVMAVSLVLTRGKRMFGSMV